MRTLAAIVVLCLAIAALRALLSVVAVAIVLLLLWGLLFRTQETVGILIFGLACSAFQAFPIMFLASITTLLGISLMAGGRSD